MRGLQKLSDAELDQLEALGYLQREAEDARDALPEASAAAEEVTP